MLAIGLALAMIGALALATRFAADNALIQGTGTVKHLDFEGGFFGIVGDDGGNYDPINMPQEFQVEGLQVRFTAYITDYATTHMWGRVVRLATIERLP